MKDICIYLWRGKGLWEGRARGRQSWYGAHLSGKEKRPWDHHLICLARHPAEGVGRYPHIDGGVHGGKEVRDYSHLVDAFHLQSW